jgi:hypothetical protein
MTENIPIPDFTSPAIKQEQNWLEIWFLPNFVKSCFQMLNSRPVAEWSNNRMLTKWQTFQKWDNYSSFQIVKTGLDRFF